jgi:serine protease Do
VRSLPLSRFLPATFVWCLLAVLLAIAPSSAQPSTLSLTRELTATPSLAVSPPPKPAAINPRDLPVVFIKNTPASLADLRIMQRHVEALIPQLSPAVVAVEVGSGSGSGVVVSPEGLVLTAGHVCGRPGRDVTFTFPDGRKADGKTLGVNEDDDTGMMKITDPGPWPFVPLGDLTHSHLGDWTLAFGHPGGFDPERSLVIRLGRIIRLTPDILQTDCTLSPGDSGGPLFDMYGRVIGIHTAIGSSLTENFHVSLTDFFGDWSQLVTGVRMAQTQAPEPPPTYTGATVVNDAAGCRLSAVAEGSPAFKAGLRAGDIILEVEGRQIQLSATFERWVAETGPGETLSLQVERNGKVLSLAIKL